MTSQLTTNRHEIAPIEIQGFLAKYSKSARPTIESSLNHFFSFLIQNDFRISEINQDILNIYQNVTREQVGQYRYVSKITTVKLFLQHIGKRFSFKITQPDPYQNSRLISEDILKRLLTHIENSMANCSPKKYRIALRDLIFFKLLFLTGLRKSEALSLRYSDVWMERGDYIYSVVIKGNREIRKEFPGELIPSLFELKALEHKDADDFIFTSTSKEQMNQSSMNFILKKYLKLIDSPEHVTVHSIRNLSILAVYELTNDIFISRDHANHVHVATNEMYIDKIRKRSRIPHRLMMDRLKEPEYQLV